MSLLSLHALYRASWKLLVLLFLICNIRWRQQYQDSF